ncbi:MAG TPA: HEAT repeat domain-containing protein [Phycisphaerae bacterium]|nr:HEAT repeat domain-containing protein [Phycisphaerae bacterium]
MQKRPRRPRRKVPARVGAAALICLALSCRQVDRSAVPASQPHGGPVSTPEALRVANLAAERLGKSMSHVAQPFREVVVEMLAHPDPAARAAAAVRLRDLANVAACAPLAAALRDPHPEVRAAAADALGWIPDGGAAGPLMRVLNDGHPEVRAAAAGALGRVRDPNAVGPLLKALSDDEPAVRAGAAGALGAIRDSQAVGPLSAALKDPDPRVAARAAGALGRIGDPRGVDPLTAALSHPSAEVRYCAVGALLALGDRRCVPTLIRRLGDASPPVRCAAARALGRLGDPRAAGPLQAALEIPDESLRTAVREALHRLAATQPTGGGGRLNEKPRRRGESAAGAIRDPGALLADAAAKGPQMTQQFDEVSHPRVDLPRRQKQVRLPQRRTQVLRLCVRQRDSSLRCAYHTSACLHALLHILLLSSLRRPPKDMLPVKHIGADLTRRKVVRAQETGQQRPRVRCLAPSHGRHVLVSSGRGRGCFRIW